MRQFGSRVTRRPVRLAEVRIPHLRLVVLTCAAAAFGVLLWASRDFQFYYDEWSFVLHQPPDPGAYFLAHNEHWSTVPLLLYHALLTAAGMRSHLPFTAANLLLHLSSSLLLFRIVRRRSGDLLALGAFALLLVFGWGSEEILQAFQMSFQGSILFGLIAIDLLDAKRLDFWRGVATSTAMVISLASSGIGIAFLAAIAVQLALDRHRRRRLLVLVFPAAVQLVWFLAVGHSHVNVQVGLASPSALVHLVGFVLYGVGASMAGIAGFGIAFREAGVFLSVLPVIAVVVIGSRRPLDSRVFGALAGIVAEFTLAGAVRAQLGVTEAASPRYVYVGAVFLLLLGTGVIGRLSLRSPRLPVEILAVALAIALAGNIAVLRHAQVSMVEKSLVSSVELRTLNAVRGAPGLRLNVSPDSVLMPQLTVGAFFAAEDRLGSPVSPGTVKALARSDPLIVERVLRSVLAAGHAP